jgi:hypothetical protein
MKPNTDFRLQSLLDEVLQRLVNELLHTLDELSM